MKQSHKKILFIALAALVLVGAAWLVNALVGNPISKSLATRTAEQHLAQVYADGDFTIDRVTFNFKTGGYYAYISSPSSRDSSFTLSISLGGKLLYDDYEDRVTNGRNTADRIDAAYRELINGVLESPEFPYNPHIAFGEIVYVPQKYADDPSVPDYALISDDLIRDAAYDVNAMGATAGKLTLYLEDSTVSAERLAEILLEVKDLFDGAGVNFRYVDCVLEHPKSKNGSRPEGRVEVMDFPAEKIYEEGMTDRVKASDQAAKDYYAEQDAQKQAEEPLN